MNASPLPNNLGWDDGQLWLDADLAAYLRVDVADLDDVVNNGNLPCFKLAGLGRRAVPELVREWAVRCCGNTSLPATTTTKTATKKRKARPGSGAARVQP